VQDAFTVNGSLGATVATFSTKSGRTLRSFERLDEPRPAVVALASGVADPARPVSMDEVIAGFNPAHARLPAQREKASRIAAQLSDLLGGTVIGILIGTLIATFFARRLALGMRTVLDFVWLLVVTSGAIAASKWIIRRCATDPRFRERLRRQ
jgi:hypothetical protein